jgi:hypothetical protein
MSSRLLGSSYVVVSARSLPDVRAGHVFRVLGNSLPFNETGFAWLGEPTGRPPDLLERMPVPNRAKLPDAARRAERRLAVAAIGDTAETTPVPHQHTI